MSSAYEFPHHGYLSPRYSAGMANAAWVIRSGRYGERDEWALENSCSGGG